MGIVQTSLFFFLYVPCSGLRKSHRRKVVRQRKTSCSGYIDPCIHHLYHLSIFLGVFLDFLVVGKYQSCAKNSSYLLKTLLREFIPKSSMILNLLVLLSQLWVSSRPNFFLSLPVQASRLLLLHCYLTLKCASWTPLWVPGAGSPTGLDFTSKELLRGVEPACSWEGSGNHSLISFFTTCHKSWTAPLCPEENRRRLHSFPDKEAQGFLRCFLYFENLPIRTLKRNTASLASDGQFAILRGPRIQVALSPCRPS